MALRPSSLFTAQVCIIVAYIIFNHCTYALHSDLKKGEKMPKSGPLLTFAFHLAFMYTVLEYYVKYEYYQCLIQIIQAMVIGVLFCT